MVPRRVVGLDGGQETDPGLRHGAHRDGPAARDPRPKAVPLASRRCCSTLLLLLLSSFLLLLMFFCCCCCIFVVVVGGVYGGVERASKREANRRGGGDTSLVGFFEKVIHLTTSQT